MAFAYKPKQSFTWRIGFYDEITGKLKTISAKTRNEAEARKKAKEYTAKKTLRINEDRLISSKTKTIKLSEAFELFKSSKSLTVKTITNYRTSIDKFISIVKDRPLYTYNKADFTKLLIFLNQPYKAGMDEDGKPIYKKYAQNTKANFSRHLRSFFQWMLEQEFINANIIQNIKRETKEVEIINDEDLESIFDKLRNDTIREKYFNVIMLKYLAALRLNEIVEVHKSDINIKNSYLIVRNSKGNRTDKIPLTSDLLELVKSFELSGDGRLFPFLSYEGLKSFWRRLMDTLNMRYGIHQLRKTRGTKLAEAGVNPYFLQKFMRHNSFSTTEQYYIHINLDKARLEIDSKL